MKNIHVLPTDKPSRLRYNLSNILVLTKEAYRDYRKQVNQNIFITNDEEIKEGDWCLDTLSDILFISDGNLLLHRRTDKKIILTTDQDLIKDGVQAIDDEFLQWFVKNPSCEWVEVHLVPINEFGSEITVNGYGFDKFIYKIIIPKEEPKQTDWKDSTKALMEAYGDNPKDFPYEKPKREFVGNASKWNIEDFEEPKQETLEDKFQFWNELIQEVGGEKELLRILKLPHIAPLIREAMRSNCKNT